MARGERSEHHPRRKVDRSSLDSTSGSIGRYSATECDFCGRPADKDTKLITTENHGDVCPDCHADQMWKR
jgi:hypothetical protein